MNTNTKLTIGMDLGDLNSALCALNSVSDEVQWRATVDNTQDELHAFFSKFEDPSSIVVAMETGTHSPWISDLLLAMGFGVIVANSRKINAISEAKIKDDDRDAEMLARLARCDEKLLSAVKHRSVQTRLDLMVIKARDGLVKVRTNLTNQVRGLVKSVGGRIPTCSPDAFPKTARNALPKELRRVLRELLGAHETISKRIRAYDRQIKKLSEKRYAAPVQKLRKIKGVGSITALAFVLIIDNPENFRKSRDVGPYLGLTPGRSQSGATDKQLSITKAGNPMMRRLLVNSANYIMGPFGEDCDLLRYGNRIAARGGKISRAKAKVAVARKLAVLMHQLLVSDNQYNPFHNNPRAAAAANAAAIAAMGNVA